MGTVKSRSRKGVPAPPCGFGALTVPEAAAYLRVSRSSVYNLFERGDLRPIKVGGRTLIRKADVDALLDREARTSGPWARSNRGEAARAARTASASASASAAVDVFA
ncbi:helix-turn-helix domain-containing protein [Blastochloris tepida]|uniref:Helix-turn-helix domain-containing protein n=1 Tax=Blastochloris tepida TaxID=2233851 RepID=A0A348FXU3_9HYPH|nr:helix-turn-helix domain-containing protein [Blastochloris tepida]BBF92126.1 hypothetical protein BLTE_08110 [Blastochloris tepida]